MRTTPTRRAIAGLGMLEVLVAGACFCVTLVPLLTMLSTNQSASHRRLVRMSLSAAAATIVDCVAELPEPLLESIPEDPAAPPPMVMMIIRATTGGAPPIPGGPDGPPGPGGPPAGGGPPGGGPPGGGPSGAGAPPGPGGSAAMDSLLSHLVPGIGKQTYGVTIGLEKHVHGNRHLACVTVMLRPLNKGSGLSSMRVMRLICTRR